MLSDREIAELRTLAALGSAPPDVVERLVVDLVELRVQLHRQRERMRLEQERLFDLLERVRASAFEPIARLDEGVEALVAEIDDALRPRVAQRPGKTAS